MPRDHSIEAYRQKRDFAKTPEPAPGLPSVVAGAGKTFVVHRHEARRLHYDLRLEFEGVLKCFAVPKGFSFTPQDKHLAVRTEDHPLDYIEFRGRIPMGEYGGGTMLIWDQGNYEVLQSASLGEALQKGELKLLLSGYRLRGEWHLVRTKKEPEQWLLFKSRDVYARTKEEPPPPLISRDQKPTELPRSPKLMKYSGQITPFDDPAWGFEPELEGERSLLFRLPESVHFSSSKLSAKKAPGVEPLLHSAQNLHGRNLVLDGVISAVDANGRPRPVATPELISGQSVPDCHLVYYAFDLLYFDEWDLRDLPLEHRKRLLAGVVPPNSSVLMVDSIVGSGTTLATAAKQSEILGLIAKRMDSPYRSGPRDDWQRIELKNWKAAAPAATVGEGRVKPKNLQKVYWPTEGYTKGDLLLYYSTVADTLLPYLRDRPVHLLRYPDGIEGKWFYQKQVMEYVPDWIRTVSVDQTEDGQDVRYIVCDSRDTLLYLINLGSIDLHPWMSRTQSMTSPDIAFIDLDPKTAPFSHVVRLAKQTGRVLRGIGITPYLKTSGKSGIHIAIPLLPGYSYEHSRMFCESVARVIVRENPDIATVERNPKSRGGKVYVDFLQNRQEQTIVPPYVVRPVPGAQVSAPLQWDELEAELEPGMFTIRNMPERLRLLGDLFEGSLQPQVDLLQAVAQLEEYVRG